jgi:thiosulfate dehydrogenase (quinone) large subunit
MWTPIGSNRGTGPAATVAVGWFLVPLRLFLGGTFLFAGLQKLANPQFFSNDSPISIHSQLVAASHTSPIHAFVVHLIPVADGVGVVIAVGEVAIGLGVLVGLWMRVAAGAGMLVSFNLFLSVSFHASPYFTGSDIVFFFAWTPFVLAGAAGAPALDTWLARRKATAPAPAGGIPRRAVLTQAAWAGVVAGAVLVGGGLAALLGRAAGGSSSPVDGAVALGGSTPPATVPSTSSRTGGSPPSTTEAHAYPGTSIGTTSQVPVGGWAAFTDPNSGDPSLVIHHGGDDFVAFDAVCPHAGCTVAYLPSSKLIACPCHGSEFDANTGAVTRGPATRGLTPLTIAAEPNGRLYVTE